MKNKIRLVFINIAVTTLFISILNLFSNLALFLPPTIRNFFFLYSQDSRREKTPKPEDPRPQLPNYANDRDSAKLHFKEYKSTETRYEAFEGWSRKPFQGKTVTIDTQGNRVHKINVHGKYINKSVYFFGGSTIWGVGVPDNETIPALFSSISETTSSNQGELSYTSRQSLARFINLLAQGEQIDIAIFYDGVNDVESHCRSELKVNEHGQTKVIRETLENRSKLRKKLETIKTSKQPYEEFLEYLDYVFLFGTRNLAAKISRKLSDTQTVKRQGKDRPKRRSIDQTYVCDNSEERAQRVAETLVNNWEIAHEIAEARGIKFLAILQPVAYIGTPKVEHLQGNPKLGKVQLDGKYGQQLGLQYKIVYPLIKNIIREREHKWILDYTDKFSHDEYLYIDFAHVSQHGNLIIARQIYADIKRY